MTALIVLYMASAAGLVLGGSELSPGTFWCAFGLLALVACYASWRFIHLLFGPRV